MYISPGRLASLCLAGLLAAASAVSHAEIQPEKVSFDSLASGKHAARLDGYWYKPAGKPRVPAVVMFHGCAAPVTKSGSVKRREREAAVALAERGYGVLLIDSLTPRGVNSQCSLPVSERPVRGATIRMDGYGALAYLNQRPDVERGKVAAFGMTFAGTYALNALDSALIPYGRTQERFAAAVAIAPSCKSVVTRKTAFQASAPTLMLSGAADTKTPAEPCTDLAERGKAKGESIDIHVYADAPEDFFRENKWRADVYDRIKRFLDESFSRPTPAAGRPAPDAAGVAEEDLNPEAASGYTEKKVVTASRFMLASANPLATQAGYDVLRKGGSAVDAAIATQLVLTLVEPQSSGLGGGAFIMVYQAAEDTLRAYDGRDAAPAAARPDRFMRNGKPMPIREAINSGLSVGTPGLLRVMELAHQRHGKLPWAELFQPAIDLAERGFPVSPRLHALLAKNKDLPKQKAAAAYFLDNDGKPWPVGHVLKNPQLAEVLRIVARQGADAFYRGEIARDIVAAVRGHDVPGDLTEADLAGYQAKEREPLCGVYRAYRLCGMPPPSSGTLAVLQMLGVLQHYPMQRHGPGSVQAVHYFSEAGRLAFADRDFYVGDPDFVSVPTQALLDPAYLKARAALIDPKRSMGTAEPGDPTGELAALGKDDALDLPSTSHIVAVDAEGNALSMTTTIESEFGSKIFVRGFLLNNQLTDFSRSPEDEAGRPVANRVEGGKRPRSSMAPMVVFRDGKPYMVVGSPGGSAIINYVAKTLVGVLDWGLDIQQAISLPNMGSRNKQTELEKGTSLAALVEPLRAMGHEVSLLDFPSGLQGIVMDGKMLQGGADPRREGLVMGD
jgi:gamma-glutamyltranspeptidase